MDFTAVSEKLKKRGYDVRVFATGADAAAWLDGTLDGTEIGVGGSLTVQELDVVTRLRKHNTVWWHWLTDEKEQYGVNGVRDRAMTCESYLCSVNALAESGELVNIDATGNRIASTAYGHKRLFFVIGRNKLTPSPADAIFRARNVAAPKNAQRMGRKTPCAVRGDRCYDCSSAERICRGLLILDRPMNGTHTTVLLIDEDLGA